jgi:hypothetical protein
MTARYDEAVAELYRVPLGSFVAERKRLAGTLDAGESKLFLKLPRPSLSAWAVNQLYAEARADFDELFATAERVRSGELDATAEHRQVTNRLVTRASELLQSSGHAASDSTLRRVTTNLAALAAEGSFAPDLPGALTTDREPPGFGAAFGISAPSLDRAPSAPRAESSGTSQARRAARADGEAQQRAEAERARAAEERARAAEERKRLTAELGRLRSERRHVEGALRAASADLAARAAERERLAAELAAAESALAKAQELVDGLEKRRGDLADAEASIKVPADDA